MYGIAALLNVQDSITSKPVSSLKLTVFFTDSILVAVDFVFDRNQVGGPKSGILACWSTWRTILVLDRSHLKVTTCRFIEQVRVKLQQHIRKLLINLCLVLTTDVICLWSSDHIVGLPDFVLIVRVQKKTPSGQAVCLFYEPKTRNFRYCHLQDDWRNFSTHHHENLETRNTHFGLMLHQQP